MSLGFTEQLVKCSNFAVVPSVLEQKLNDCFCFLQVDTWQMYFSLWDPQTHLPCDSAVYLPRVMRKLECLHATRVLTVVTVSCPELWT